MLSERGRGRLLGGLTFLQPIGLIVPFVLQMVDDIHILSMLSLNQAHAAAGAAADSLREVALALGTTRRWANLSKLLVIDACDSPPVAG
jgi:hypothetical protein